MTTTKTPARPRRELIAWRNAVFVIFALSGIGLSSWTARVPGVRDALHLDTAQMGLLILTLSGGAVLGLVGAAPTLTRIGAKRGMVTSLCLVAIGLVLVGVGTTIAPSVPIVAIGLVLSGYGNGSVDVMMNVEAAAAEREVGKTIMPLMHACFSMGAVIGAGIGAGAAALNISIFVHLIVIAAIIIVGVFIAVTFVPLRAQLGDEPSEHSEQSGVGASVDRPGFGERLKAALMVWADWRLILIGVVMLGMAFAEGSANDWLALAVVDGHHQDNATGAAVFGVFVVAMTVGRVAGGPLVDRLGRVAAIRITAALGVVGLLIFILGGPLWIVIIGAILWGIGASLGFPLGMSAAADDEKNAAARVSAVAMIGYCAFLVGPPLIGFLGQAFGILGALFVIFVLLIASGLAAPAVRKRD
jgi:MFS family permease